MFVVFEIKSKEYGIKKLDMSGKAENEDFLKISRLMGPRISLAYSFKFKCLFFADVGSGLISSICDSGEFTLIYLHSNDVFLCLSNFFVIIFRLFFLLKKFLMFLDSDESYFRPTYTRESTSISLAGNFMYWTERNAKQLFYVNLSKSRRIFKVIINFGKYDYYLN